MYYGLGLGFSLAIVTEIIGYFYERNQERKFNQICEEHTRISNELMAVLNTEEAGEILKKLQG